MYINYEQELNSAQLEAVTTQDGPVLVIAGAGSGKTRTIVYRLARLIEQDIAAHKILLLTFTRKAASEMVNRASELLHQPQLAVAGGTFHGYAFQILRTYAPVLGFDQGISIMDKMDAESLLKQAREELGIGKGDKTFPKKNTMAGLLSCTRNKECSLESLLDAQWHLRGYHDDLLKIFDYYRELKKRYGMMDYDDLLFYFETLLSQHPEERQKISSFISHIMVDEYQDTNPVQARLVSLLTNQHQNVMAVGDDAQSIYGFRGADISNILNFPDQFTNTKIIKLEQNYRSTQPILHLTNSLLLQADERFKKRLFSDIDSTALPQVHYTISDKSQAKMVVAKIKQLVDTKYPLEEIAVLFRSGFHSYALEIELKRERIAFRKFGGIKFSEAAHIKDVLAFIRVADNPGDRPAWQRVLEMVPGVGPKTAPKIQMAALDRDENSLQKFCKRSPQLRSVLDLIEKLRAGIPSPVQALELVMQHYLPIMEKKFADDYPRRASGLEELGHIASGYDSLSSFLADLNLENQEHLGGQEDPQQILTLSTIHSSKGLEWDAVLLIDLVEERFPSRHALQDSREMQEELRLMYVACTRARNYLGLFIPQTIFNKSRLTIESMITSPFVRGLPEETYEKRNESFAGTSRKVQPKAYEPKSEFKKGGFQKTKKLGYCQHKIFGRGKIIKDEPPDKYRVNFPGFGIKLILKDYLQLED